MSALRWSHGVKFPDTESLQHTKQYFTPSGILLVFNSPRDTSHGNPPPTLAGIISV